MPHAPGPLVLVAEHHADTRTMLRELFRIHGVSAEECGDGDAALEAALRIRPNVILLDSSLPGLDSLALIRRLRSSSAMHNVRIVFVSDDGGPNDEARARAAGSDHYLLKPVDLHEVLRLVGPSPSGSFASTAS